MHLNNKTTTLTNKNQQNKQLFNNKYNKQRFHRYTKNTRVLRNSPTTVTNFRFTKNAPPYPPSIKIRKSNKPNIYNNRSIKNQPARHS